MNAFLKKPVNSAPIRIGTSFDASKMSPDDVFKKIRSRTNEADWDTGYGLFYLYSTANWRGNEPNAKFTRFVHYCEDHLMGEHAARIRMLIDVYSTYAVYQDAKIVDLVKEIGMSKADIAIPYTVGLPTQKVRDLLKLASVTPARALRDALRNFIGGSTKPPRDKSAGGDKEAARAIEMISHKDGGLLNMELFIPRCVPQAAMHEVAWWALFQTFRKSQDLSVDEAFAELMRMLAQSMPQDVLDEAHNKWAQAMEFMRRSHSRDLWFFRDLDADYVPGEPSDTESA